MFSMFYVYTSVIFIHSVYGKEENYHPIVFLEESIHIFFWRSIKTFLVFWGFGSSS